MAGFDINSQVPTLPAHSTPKSLLDWKPWQPADDPAAESPTTAEPASSGQTAQPDPNAAVAGDALMKSSLERARLGERSLRTVGPGGVRSGKIRGRRMSAADFYSPGGPGGKVLAATEGADPYSKAAAGVALEGSEAIASSLGMPAGSSVTPQIGGTYAGPVPSAPQGSSIPGLNAIDPAARRAEEAGWMAARTQQNRDASPAVAAARAGVADENMNREIQKIVARNPADNVQRARSLSGMPGVVGPVTIKDVFGDGSTRTATASGGSVTRSGASTLARDQIDEGATVADTRKFSAPLKLQAA